MYPARSLTSPVTWQRQAVRLLRLYLAPHWPLAAVVGVLIAAEAGLQLLGPQIMQRAIDAIMAGTGVSYLARLAVFFMLAAVGARAVQAATTYFTADLGWRATNRLRGDLAHHTLSLPLHFHAELTPGQLAERIDGDVRALFNFFSQFLLQLLANAFLVAGAIIVLFGKDWRIGLAFVVSLGVTLLVYGRVANVAVSASRAERQAQSELMGVLEENLSGAEDARPLGATSYLMERFYRAARKAVYAARSSWPRAGIPWAVTAIVMGLNEAIGLALGTRLVEGGALTIGAVYLIAQYSDLIAMPLRQMARQMGDLQAAGASVSRVSDLLGREREGAARQELVCPAAPSDRRPLPGGPLGVRFEAVTLAYGDGPAVLKDLSFDLAAGSSLGVVGRTGGGKSSLARLLLRLYEPTAGTISIGSGAEWQDIRALPLDELRRHVALVTQEVQLFPASVRENLTLFGALAGVSDERLTWAIDEVGLGGWLRALPAGLDTPLRSGDAGLSAGQAQLLALARVFVRDPGLVLLDEASSRLDPSSQALLARAVDRLLAGRTALVIAHRLQTLQRVDRVMVLEDGEASEIGARDVLAADGHSRFHHLLQTGAGEPGQAPEA
ncbi:MAG: ABC transporter ATP-binding protein [Anaerolineae bacterium]